MPRVRRRGGEDGLTGQEVQASEIPVSPPRKARMKHIVVKVAGGQSRSLKAKEKLLK